MFFIRESFIFMKNTGLVFWFIAFKIAHNIKFSQKFSTRGCVLVYSFSLQCLVEFISVPGVFFVGYKINLFNR